MDKNELKKVILSYGDKIGAIGISLDYISKGDFVIGYGFDDKEKKWRVYENVERGWSIGQLFESEEEALEYLYRVVLRYHEYDERDKERRRKIAAEKQK